MIIIFSYIENYKMARHLTKYRRFVLDTNHIDSLSTQSGSSAGLSSGSP